MSIELSKDDRAMIRAGAGDLDTAGVQALEAGVVSRLTKMIERGEISRVTRNNIRAAIALETGRGK
ncbi:hypothetical protein [Bradyrhizobium sp. JYMT SZCCT0180]|uniref:hypothetical protein n=1 Tax=Bradyrhizobium sp. JYMT SZCCT0180 TaxID=2807666 RepID=UPI001BA47E73|nr:hypothetical protein [Bradyrhizobium sp. JYMT SZCCT0180]MBR1211111.1 hypothetical protein [Bradyrhizobium sp. JYMT SZCCT0180]